MPQITQTLGCRFLPAGARRGLRLESRAEGDDGLPKILGTGIVYYDENNRAGTQYQLWDNVFERIHAGAADVAVVEDDIRALQNHMVTMLLGRSTKGTLKLLLRTHGVDYEIDTPDTTAGRDTVTLLDRGDLDGSSFSFRATEVEWTEEVTEDNVILHIRNIKAMRMADIGPVTFPAYTATNSGTRGIISPECGWWDSLDIAAEMKGIRG